MYYANFSVYRRLLTTYTSVYIERRTERGIQVLDNKLALHNFSSYLGKRALNRCAILAITL